MPARTLVTFASLSLASLLIWGCADGPSSAANGALPGAPAGPSVDSGPGELTLGSGAPAPGAAATGCSDDDLQCICELALAVFDKCGFIFDGEDVEIPRDACSRGGQIDELASEFCQDGDCGPVNQVLTCVVDSAICTEDTFQSCAANLDGGFVQQPEPDGPGITCGDGQFVPASRVCDGEADCADGIDELVCQ